VCEVSPTSGKLVVIAIRTSRNIYVLNEIEKESCCLGKENESWLWNRRMDHMQFDNIFKISRKEAVREMPEISNIANTLCKHCLQGKKPRTKFKSKEYSTKKPLEIVHTDLCGQTRTKGLNGEQYFMLLNYEYKRIIAVFFLNKKLEAFEHFKIYKEMVET
jgi:hypothetical protein